MANPVQGNSVSFPPLESALVDAEQKCTTPWYLFLRSLFARTGGGTGAPNALSQNTADTGASQASAAALIPGVAFVTGTGAGVALPAMQAGQFMVVFNVGAGGTNVYPPAGAGINALAVNAAFPVPTLKCQIFWFQSVTQIRTMTFA